MSYQVLARKWRPKKFQDVIGQDHVVRSLQNAILKNQVGHAYMFVGTRGVGKTTLARLFAKALRCENLQPDGNACLKCAACKDFEVDSSMNVIEVDGASNNSVDNIRDLVSNVHYLPTSGKYKVYIIDEVHMLSTSAFNALLKTLEEPPAHVVFIFATTEAHKLLGTVLSRCQRFDLKNATIDKITENLKKIFQVEGIKFSDEKLINELAILANGSFRDSLSLMDQLLTYADNNYVDENVFTASLGIAGPSAVAKLKDAIVNGDESSTKQIYQKMIEDNISLKNLVASLLNLFYKEIKENQTLSKAELIFIYESLARETSWIFSSLSPDKTVEILLIKLALRNTFFHQVKKTEPRKQVEQNEQVEQVVQKEQVDKIESREELIREITPVDKTWDSFLSFLHSKSPASASNLEQGNLTKPIMKTESQVNIELGFSYSAQVFYDYLREPEVFKKLVLNVSEFFQIPTDKVFIDLIEVKNSEEFVSKAEIREIEHKNEKAEKMNELKNNPLLKEAERIFNSRVDKVILDKK